MEIGRRWGGVCGVRWGQVEERGRRDAALGGVRAGAVAQIGGVIDEDRCKIRV